VTRENNNTIYELSISQWATSEYDIVTSKWNGMLSLF
jgi:hypothetical protein